jgi:hypothetical protein
MKQAKAMPSTEDVGAATDWNPKTKVQKIRR